MHSCSPACDEKRACQQGIALATGLFERYTAPSPNFLPTLDLGRPPGQAAYSKQMPGCLRALDMVAPSLAGKPGLVFSRPVAAKNPHSSGVEHEVLAVKCQEVLSRHRDIERRETGTARLMLWCGRCQL